MSGDLSYLMTDIVGSTPLWEREPTAMAQAMVLHESALRSAVEAHDGQLLSEHGEGDSAVAVFPRAADALLAALDAQRGLQAQPWPTSTAVEVRMAVHTGPATDQHLGSTLNRCARIRALAGGRQVLLSAVSASLSDGLLPEQATTVALGEVVLKGLEQPEQVHQLLHPELDSSAVVLTLREGPTNLPPRTSPIGRDDLLDAITEALRARGQVVALVGPGGVGKTTMAVEAGHRSRAEFPDGVWFVDLRPLPPDGDVIGAVAAVVPVPDGDQPIRQRLAEALASTLLIIDNTEHVPGAARAIRELVAMSPDVRVLSTSRVRGADERTVVVPPLVAEGAAALLHERAAQARPGLELDAATTSALVEAVDGLPLALELAAARLRVLSPHDLLQRLTASTDVLDSRTAERTLRATLQWSWDLLELPLRDLLAALSVFAGPVDLQAIAAVCAPDLDELDLLDALQELVDSSLLVVDDTDADTATYRLLVPVRSFAEEHLTEQVRDQHLQWLVDLAEGLRESPDSVRMRALSPYLPEVVRALHRALDIRVEQGLALMGGVIALLHRPAARDLLPLADRAARLTPDLELRGALLAQLGLIRLWNDDLAGGERALLEALEQVTPKRAPQVYFYLGHVEIQRDLDRAIEMYAKAGEAARAVGDTAFESYAHNNIGLVHSMRGELQAALVCHREAERVALTDEAATRPQVIIARSNAEIAEHWLGRRRWGSAFVRDLLSYAEGLDNPVHLLQLRCQLAEALASEGELEQACDIAEGVLKDSQRGSLPVTPQALSVLADIRRTQGRLPEAQALIDRATELDPPMTYGVLVAASAARLGLALGQPAVVRRCAQQIEERTKDAVPRTEAWALTAAAELQAGNLAAAAEALDRARAAAPALDAPNQRLVLQIASEMAASAEQWELAAQLGEAARQSLPWELDPLLGTVGGEDVPQRALEALGPERYAEALRALPAPRKLLELLPR